MDGDTGANEEMSLPLCAPLSFLMTLKHRLDRTDRWGRESGVGPGGLVWLNRGEDFGVEVHVLLTRGPST